MNKIDILAQIRCNEKLLSLPQVLSEILEEVGKDDFSADTLAKIILKDPSLTSRLLKMANSSFYQRVTEIKTVHQAVSILGVTTVKCLTLSASIFNPDRIAASTGIDTKQFFAYSLSIASASEKIARTVNYPSPEEAFIAGLLHDIGVLFFLHHYPDEYARILRGETIAESLVDAEMKVFGVDHCDIGYHLAEVWRLPDYVADAIISHHGQRSSAPSSVLQNAVGLGVQLTSDRFSGYETSLEKRLQMIGELSERLSLTKSQVDEISSSLLAGTISTAEYLGVDIGNIEDMLIRANQEIWHSFLTIENLFRERQELSQSLLLQEREKGAIEAKNVAMATLSHYLNNATMAIYGRSQLLRMKLSKGDTENLLAKLPHDLEVVDRSIERIVAVLEEMREISPIDQQKYYDMSKALNIDDRIKQRLEKMGTDGAWASRVEMAPKV